MDVEWNIEPINSLVLAVHKLRGYAAERCACRGANDAHVASATALADKIEAWSVDHAEEIDPELFNSKSEGCPMDFTRIRRICQPHLIVEVSQNSRT